MEELPKFGSLINTISRADDEFGRDLWLIAERIVLFRLTRTSDREAELKSIITVIQRMTGESPSGARSSDEGIVVDHKILARGFSSAVDLIEGMDFSQLYRLIAWLRNESAG